MHHAFLYISLWLLHDYDMNWMPIFRYCGAWREHKRTTFIFSNLFPVLLNPFCCFYLMYPSFRSVTDRNSKILTPTRKGNFLLTSMDREFYATDVSTKERPCFSFLEVRYTLLEFNSRKNCQHLTNWTRRNKCNEVRLHFVSDFFVALAVVVA